MPVLLFVIAGVAAVSHAMSEKTSGKKISFTSKSKEAVASVEKVVYGIETLQPPARWLEEARKAVAADPQFAFAHYLLATATLGQPESREHADKAVALAKTASDGERRYIEAVLLARSQETDKAIAAFEQLTQQYPGDRMSMMLLGQVYMNKGSLDQARAAFKRAAEIDDSTPRVHIFQGNIEMLKDEYAKARDLFASALKRTVAGSIPFGASYGIAFTHIYQGNLDAAVKTLESFRQEYEKSGGAPNLPPVFIWNSIGRLLIETGKPEEALKAYDKGYQSVPGSQLTERDKKLWLGRLHHGRGRALARMGKAEDAWKEVELIKKMIDDAGEEGKQFMPAYHYMAGFLKLEARDYAKAVEHLKQADPNDPYHKLLLARAYEKTGDRENARKLYQEIVSSTQVTLERALAYPEAKKKLAS
jgi:tetratricopeptide (TPR) repeat protein